MVDSLGVFLPDAQAPGDRLAELRPLRNGEGFRGLLGNLRVIQGQEGVYVQGSLPVYLNGENVRTFSRQGLLAALGKLESESGLTLHAGRVLQLETAATLPVREAPRRYLESWGPLPRFRKDTYGGGETVLYRTGGRSFTGYDKGAEFAPEPLPCPLEGRYALRLEITLQAGATASPGPFYKPLGARRARALPRDRGALGTSILRHSQKAGGLLSYGRIDHKTTGAEPCGSRIADPRPGSSQRHNTRWTGIRGAGPYNRYKDASAGTGTRTGRKVDEYRVFNARDR
jgi:hypothetical protein